MARAFLRRRQQHRAESKRVEFERMESSVRLHREANDARGLDDRCSRLRIPPPRRPHWTVRGIDSAHRLRARAEQRGQDLAETVAAVAHREQVKMIVRAGATPTGSDRSGGLLRCERALELVGNDQDAHRFGMAIGNWQMAVARVTNARLEASALSSFVLVAQGRSTAHCFNSSNCHFINPVEGWFKSCARSNRRACGAIKRGTMPRPFS